MSKVKTAVKVAVAAWFLSDEIRWIKQKLSDLIHGR